MLQTQGMLPPDYTNLFIILADASLIGIRGVLGQKSSESKDRILKPIESFGSKLKRIQLNYAAPVKQTPALVEVN